jgi:hypothetical protein
MLSVPAFSATAQRQVGSEGTAEVVFRFDAPLSRSVEMPAGIRVPLRERSQIDASRFVTTDALVVTPPAIVALERERSAGATEDLLPRARRGLSLGVPLSRSSEGGQGLRVAVAGRLAGAVLRVVLWSTHDGALDPLRADFGSWEVWSGNDLAWRRTEAGYGVLRSAERLGVEQREVGAEPLRRRGRRSQELVIPRSPARHGLSRPSRWWLRVTPSGSDGAYVGMVRAVAVEVHGVVVGARVLSESGPAPIDPAAVLPDSPGKAGSDLPAGPPESPWSAASAPMVGTRLPFRLLSLPK